MVALHQEATNLAVLLALYRLGKERPSIKQNSNLT